MNKTDFHRDLFLSSVQLIRLDTNRKPTGTGSGCLIDYSGKRILLTAGHVTGDQRNWAIQLRYVPGKGTYNHQIGAMNFLVKGRLEELKLDDVDFAYAEVPLSLSAVRQEIAAPANTVESEAAITIHAPTLGELPGESDEYGFCGMVKASNETHFGQPYLGGEIRVYPGLSYLRTHEDYHVFSLPFPHPGHEHFQGCSGAPILSKKTGLPVALVCGGCIQTNEIWGISLAAYKTPLDILAGSLG